MDDLGGRNPISEVLENLDALFPYLLPFRMGSEWAGKGERDRKRKREREKEREVLLIGTHGF